MTPAKRRVSSSSTQKSVADEAGMQNLSAAAIHPRTKSALENIAAQTVNQAVRGFGPALVQWATHYGLSLEGPDFAIRLFTFIAKRKRIADGELADDVPLILKSNYRAAAAYAFYQAVVDLSEREEIEIDLENALGINRAKVGPNYFLHLCLRAFVQYKKAPANSRTSISQYWFRDGLAIRYAIRMKIKPSELVAILRQPGGSVSAWVRDQHQYERNSRVRPPPPPTTSEAETQLLERKSSTVTSMSIIIREVNPKAEKYSTRRIVVTNQNIMRALVAVLSILDDG